MNVAELKEALEYYPDDMEVHAEYPSGDYWHTTLAPVVNSVYFGRVKHSNYHNADKLVEESDDDDDVDVEDTKKVVVLA